MKKINKRALQQLRINWNIIYCKKTKCYICKGLCKKNKISANNRLTFQPKVARITL